MVLAERSSEGPTDREAFAWTVPPGDGASRWPKDGREDGLLRSERSLMHRCPGQALTAKLPSCHRQEMTLLQVLWLLENKEERDFTYVYTHASSPSCLSPNVASVAADDNTTVRLAERN